MTTVSFGQQPQFSGTPKGKAAQVKKALTEGKGPTVAGVPLYRHIGPSITSLTLGALTLAAGAILAKKGSLNKQALKEVATEVGTLIGQKGKQFAGSAGQAGSGLLEKAATVIKK